MIWIGSNTGRKENTSLQQQFESERWTLKIMFKIAINQRSHFHSHFFQDFNLESGFLDGFWINNGSCISILNWVLHTLNRPHCLGRVAPVILVNGVTVAKLKECEHKTIKNKYCQRQNGRVSQRRESDWLTRPWRWCRHSTWRSIFHISSIGEQISTQGETSNMARY